MEDFQEKKETWTEKNKTFDLVSQNFYSYSFVYVSFLILHKKSFFKLSKSTLTYSISLS